MPFSGLGGGGGESWVLENILIFPFFPQKWREKCTRDRGEKTYDWSLAAWSWIKPSLGITHLCPPNWFHLSWVEEKRSIRKAGFTHCAFSVRLGFGCFKCPLNFYTPFSIHFARQQRANYFFCNYATLSPLKPSGIQGRGVGAISGRFFWINHQDKSSHIHTWRRSGSSCAIPEPYEKLKDVLKVMQSAKQLRKVTNSKFWEERERKIIFFSQSELEPPPLQIPNADISVTKCKIFFET